MSEERIAITKATIAGVGTAAAKVTEHIEKANDWTLDPSKLLTWLMIFYAIMQIAVLLPKFLGKIARWWHGDEPFIEEPEDEVEGG